MCSLFTFNRFYIGIAQKAKDKMTIFSVFKMLSNLMHSESDPSSLALIIIAGDIWVVSFIACDVSARICLFPRWIFLVANVAFFSPIHGISLDGNV